MALRVNNILSNPLFTNSNTNKYKSIAEPHSEHKYTSKRDYDELYENYLHVSQELSLVAKDYDTLNNKYKQLKQKYAALKTETNQFDEDVLCLERTTELLAQHELDMQNQLAVVLSENEQLRKLNLSLETENQDLSNKMAREMIRLDLHETIIRSISDKLEIAIKEKIEVATSLQTQHVPLADHMILQDKLKELDVNFSSISQTLSETKQELLSLTTDIENYRANEESLRDSLQSKEVEIQKNQEDRCLLDQKLSLLTQQFSQCSALLQREEELVKQRDDELKDLRSQLRDADHSICRFNIASNENNIKIQELVGERDSLAQANAALLLKVEEITIQSNDREMSKQSLAQGYKILQEEYESWQKEKIEIENKLKSVISESDQLKQTLKWYQRQSSSQRNKHCMKTLERELTATRNLIHEQIYSIDSIF